MFLCDVMSTLSRYVFTNFSEYGLSHRLSQIKGAEFLSVFHMCLPVAEDSARFQNVLNAADGDDDPAGAIV
jgi:hypothetical protein